MHAEDRNIRAVNRPAHVEAAGQSQFTLGRQLHLSKLLKNFVHNRLDHAGGVGGRGVAVNPALGMHNVGYTGAGATHREPASPGGQVVKQRLDLGFGIDHELDIVAGSPADRALAMLVCDITDFADVLNGNQPGAAHPNGVALSSGFAHMLEHPGTGNLMIQPLAVIVLDDLGKHLFVVRGTNVGDPVFHWILWIVTHI